MALVDDQVLLGAVDGRTDVVQDAGDCALRYRGRSQHRRLGGATRYDNKSRKRVTLLLSDSRSRTTYDNSISEQTPSCVDPATHDSKSVRLQSNKPPTGVIFGVNSGHVKGNGQQVPQCPLLTHHNRALVIMQTVVSLYP